MTAAADKIVQLARAAIPDILSEDSLAQSFVNFAGDDYRSVPGIGMMIWDVNRWRKDVRLAHFDGVRRLCRARGSTPDCSDADTKRLQAARTVASVTQFVKADPQIIREAHEFDVDRMVLNTPGGLIDLRTMEVIPHARQLVTKVTTVAPTFDPPTLFLQFLRDVFEGDEELIAFVRRLLGYLLTGEIREQIVVFFFGEGANGKSTLLDLLLYILHLYAIKVPSAMLMAQRNERHPTDVAQLNGVRLAVANEIAEGEHWDEQRLKELSGDEKLTARYMRQDFIQFNATHTFVVGANNRPQMRAMDHAMRRRIVLVPFNRRFEGDARDPRMLDRLKAEAAEILGWLCIGAAEWFEDGLGIPDSVRQASDAYCDSMDSMQNWMAERCELGNDELNDSSTLLYRSYHHWKQTRGESPVSQTRWAEQMRGKGFTSYRNNGIRYRGLCLTSDEAHRVHSEVQR